MQEVRRDMDHIEKIAVRQTIEQTMGYADVLKAQQRKLPKLLRSPYFGRSDFRRVGEARNLSVSAGVHHFRGQAARGTRGYEWRAPIATTCGSASSVASATCCRNSARSRWPRSAWRI